MFAEKSVYSPMTEDEGVRVLVMRQWPRGISTGRVDLWLKELGPSRESLRALETRRISWLQFEAAYMRQLREDPETIAALQTLRQLARPDRRVTLFCHERQPPCHRFILLRFLSQQE